MSTLVSCRALLYLVTLAALGPIWVRAILTHLNPRLYHPYVLQVHMNITTWTSALLLQVFFTPTSSVFLGVQNGLQP